MLKSIVKDNAHDDASILSDTDSIDSICDQIEMPRDTTAMNKSCNSQGDIKFNTQDQDLCATVQPKQHRTSQPSETSPPRTIISSQNTYNHIKQYITGPLSAKCNTGPPPLLPTSRPHHVASSKQWPALLPTPAHSRSPAIPSSRQQLPVPSPVFNHLTSPAYYGPVTESPYLAPLYLPVIILTLTDKFTKLVCQQGYKNTIHQKHYIHRGIQTDTITPLWRKQAELKQASMNSHIRWTWTYYQTFFIVIWSLKDQHDYILSSTI